MSKQRRFRSGFCFDSDSTKGATSLHGFTLKVEVLLYNMLCPFSRPAKRAAHADGFHTLDSKSESRTA